MSLKACNFFEVIKEEYADWESYMEAPELNRKWHSSLFDGSVSFRDKIVNIVTYYDMDSTKVWGKYNYTNNFFNDLPVELNQYTINTIEHNKDKKRLKKIGFDHNNIKSYFYDVSERFSDKRVLYYFIDTKENTVYFYELRL
ncbi:MAG: hypothetical protein FWD28_01140 [Treponema sp.]|nr:hypothetical protein [Treponema sp.]